MSIVVFSIQVHAANWNVAVRISSKVLFPLRCFEFSYFEKSFYATLKSVFSDFSFSLGGFRKGDTYLTGVANLNIYHTLLELYFRHFNIFYFYFRMFGVPPKRLYFKELN